LVPHSQVRKQTGNSVSVPVIKAIAEEFVKSISLKLPASPEYKQLSLEDLIECKMN
jgi:hypothetical protein